MAARRDEAARFEFVPTIKHEAWAVLDERGEIVCAWKNGGRWLSTPTVLTYWTEDEARDDPRCVRACLVVVMPVRVGRAGSRRVAAG